MSKVYHVNHADQQSGPHSETDILTSIINDNFDGTDLCWTEGMENWQPINQVLNLSPKPKSARNGIVAKVFGETATGITLRLLTLAIAILCIFIELDQQRETQLLEEKWKATPAYRGGPSYRELLDEYRKEYPHLGRPNSSRD